MKKLATFIIEDRYFDDFGESCRSHMKHLPKDTDLFVYTSPDHHEKYSEQLKGLNYQFKEYNKNVEVPYSIKYNHIIQQVQQDDRLKALLNMCLFMTEAEFWKDYFDYERVLVFQRDSGILRPGIEEFYDYDYVGAPCYNFVKDRTIQNGGFSLRCPRTMEYICRMYGWKTDLQDLMVVGQYSTASFFAEDIFFCLRMIKYNVGKLAPLEVAKKFSVESKFELGALGYHRLEPYMTKEEVDQIMTQYK